MKATTAKTPNQELQEAKVNMIPVRVAWDHIDRLDELNGALHELALLVASDDALAVPALLGLLRDQYRALSLSFGQSVKAAGIPSVH
jgi:hypothetical protein